MVTRLKLIILTLPFVLVTNCFADQPPEVRLRNASDRLVASFQNHCVACHGEEGDVEGMIDLFRLKSYTDFQSRPKDLERIISVLSDRQMPPEDEVFNCLLQKKK